MSWIAVAFVAGLAIGVIGTACFLDIEDEEDQEDALSYTGRRSWPIE